MARKAMVTRTVKGTDVVVKAYDYETENIIDVTLHLARTYHTEKELNKAVEKAAVVAKVKVLSIKEVSENTALYGMPEDFFLANADLLPPRGAKEST